MRKGFTVLELLAASLLLSMLVTILTMVFNQSSVAWRTGVAGVVRLGQTREQLGTLHDVEDDALPGLGMLGAAVDNRQIEYRTVSIFRNWNGGSGTPTPASTGRLYELIDWKNAPKWEKTDNAVCMGESRSLNGHSSSRGGKAFAIGVKSKGPKEGDPSDDISTFPEEAK